MDKRITGVDSLSEVIHKKEAKKLKAKGQLPVEPMDSSTDVLGYHSRQEPTEQGSIEQPFNSQKAAKAERSRTQMKNFQIDEYLQELVMSGMINERFVPFYAKACHKLGVSKVNQLKINTLASPKLKDKQRLFAYKVKGALQLHEKTAYEAL